MNPLDLSSILSRNEQPGPAIDICHSVLILGSLLSAKPESILELGVGTGFVTNLLLDGITYNQQGNLTCVDNFHDYNGHLQQSTLDKIASRKAKIIAPIEEKLFVINSQTDSYDFLVSDADHEHAGEWVDEIFRIMKPNSFMFFHDVSAPGYPNLANYITRSKELGKPHYLFNVNSRPNESCQRGFLMVINIKS